MKKLITLLFFTACIAQAEQYQCSYTWKGKSKSYPILIDVKGNKAIIKGRILKPIYEIASNTSTEFLIYRKFTKKISGPNYPVGFTVMALDKKTKKLTRSNTFSGIKQNNHAFGKCQKL